MTQASACQSPRVGAPTAFEQGPRDPSPLQRAPPILRNGALPVSPVNIVSCRQIHPEGRLMFTAWKLASYRPTMDIDLLGKTANQVDSVVAIVKEVCVQSVEP